MSHSVSINVNKLSWFITLYVNINIFILSDYTIHKQFNVNGYLYPYNNHIKIREPT
jgi:hypothetical protein